MKDLQHFEIEQLLAERPFDLLTPKEKETVLAQIPEWEYQRLHQLLVRSRATMKQGPKPNPAIRQNLLEALRKQNQLKPATPPNKGIIVRLAQYRMPVWQAAAGLALLLVAYLTLSKPASEVVRTETVYVTSTDTVYKEVAIPVVDTSVKIPQQRLNVNPRTSKKAATASIPVELVADTSSSRHPGNFIGLPDTLPGFKFTVQHPNGRSANEMKELWQFLGDVY